MVLRRDGEIGEIAEAGQILFRVGVPKPLQVVAEVNEEDIPRVAVGQTVLLRTDAFLGRRLEGKVQRDHADGRCGRQDLPHPHRAARRHAAQAGHERRGQCRHAREAGRAAGAGRGRARHDGVRHRRRSRASDARSTVGIRGTRAVEIVSGLSRGRAGCGAVADSACATAARVRASSRGRRR